MMGNEEVGCGRHGGHGICGVCVGERLMKKLQGFSSSSSSSSAAAATIRSSTTSYVGSVGTIASLISIDIMQQQQGSVANAAQLRRSHSVCEDHQVSHRTHSLKSLLLAEKLTDIHHSSIAAASHYNLNQLRQNPSVQAAPSTLETAAKQSRLKNFQIFGQRSTNRLTEGSHAKRSKFRSRWGFLMGRQGSEIVSVAPHNYVVRPISIDEKPAFTRSQSQGVAWSKSLFRSPMSFFRSSSLR